MAGRGYHIKASNGQVYEVTARDDSQAARLAKYINRQIAAGDPYLKKGRAPESAIVTDPKVIEGQPKPESFVQGFNESVNNVGNHAARWAEIGLNLFGGAGDTINKFGADHFGMAPSVDAAVQTQAAETEAMPTQGSTAGKFVGEVLPTALIPGGPFVSGAVTGALMSDADSVRGVGADTLLGGLGGKLGHAATRGVARLVAPVSSSGIGKNVRALINEGITALTPGQVARDSGSVAAKKLAAFEDRASGQPFVGDMITGDRAVANDQLNRAVARRALKQIGERLPDNVPTGHASVKHTGDQLSAAYEEVLPKINGSLDASFNRRVATLRDRAGLPPKYDGMINDVMAEAENAFTAGARRSTGERNQAFRRAEAGETPVVVHGAPGTTDTKGYYTGRTLRDTSDRLDKLAAGWRRSDDPYVNQVGEFASAVREQLHALARRQNPDHAERLRSIDRGYAILVRLENAAKGAKGGIFSPNQLATAVRSSDRSSRRRAVARGDALLQDLSDSASQVMPSQVGDSGTAGRWANSTVTGLAQGAAATIPYMLAKRDAQRALTAGPTARTIADLIRLGAPVASKSAAVAPSLMQQSLGK